MPAFDSDHCLYCSKVTGTDICQLPYSIVKQLRLLDESVDSIMTMTKLHCDYTDMALKNNLSFTTWKSSFPDDSHSMIDVYNAIDYFKSISSEHQSRTRSRTYSSAETQTNESFVIHANEGTVLISPFQGDEAQQDIVHDDFQPTPEVHSSNESIDSEAPTSKLMELAKDINDLVLSTEEHKDQNSVKSTNSENLELVNDSTNVTSEINDLSNDKIRISRSQFAHLINDLMIAIESTQTLTLRGKEYLLTSKLIESLQTEQKARNYHRDDYKPVINPVLDHQIAIARKIQSTHTHVDTSNWYSGTRAKCAKFCLLNFPPLMLSSEISEPTTICSTFLKYVTSVLSRTILHPDDIKDITSELKNRLSERGKPTTYTWVTNQIKIHKIQPQKVEPTQNTNVQKIWLKYDQSSHSCPVLKKEIHSYFKSHLDKLIASAITNNDLNELNPPDGFDNTEFLTLLIKEFISHNKGWTNPNSLTKPEQLTKMNQYLDVVIPEDQQKLIFKVMIKVIKDFRSLIKPLPT
jgi:hypothetical protein